MCVTCRRRGGCTCTYNSELLKCMCTCTGLTGPHVHTCTQGFPQERPFTKNHEKVGLFKDRPKVARISRKLI